MALIIHFQTKNMTEDTYTEVIRRLDAAGAGAPRGRLHHTCYGAAPLRVVDVFDTKDNFEAFGKTLLPILQQLGVEFAGPPAVDEVKHIIRG